jgi:hypothetical protein
MKIVVKKELGFANIIIYDNDVFHIHVLDRTPITIDQAQQIEALRFSLTKLPLGLTLSTSNDDFVLPTQETIKYIQSDKRSLTIKANAYVVKSFSHRLAMKAATKINKKSYSCGYFESNDKAIAWLMGLKT